jgi:hypothetical protein
MRKTQEPRGQVKKVESSQGCQTGEGLLKERW